MAMTLLGMDAQRQVQIFDTVAAVLHIGNIQFQSDGKVRHGGP
jgi:myosin heavy subunit